MVYSKKKDFVNVSKKGCLQRIVDGPATYIQKLVSCGARNCGKCFDPEADKCRPGHGPYWYLIAYSRMRGREIQMYLGSVLDTTKYRKPDGGVNFEAYFKRKDSVAG
jgi:hypothetical protein